MKGLARLMREGIAFVSLFLLALLFVPYAAQGQQPARENQGKAPSGSDIKEFVTATGAWTAPARFELHRPLRLRELIAYAGGVTERAGQIIRIEHAGAGCEKAVQRESLAMCVEVYNLIDVLSGDGKDEKFNPYLRNGDVVNLEAAGQLYVLGNVVAPQAMYMQGPLTLTGALARAGGILPDSRTDRVAIYRQGEGQERTVIYADLKAIKKHHAQDVPLQSNDIIEVSLKKGKGTFWRPYYIPVRGPVNNQLPVRVIP